MRIPDLRLFCGGGGRLTLIYQIYQTFACPSELDVSKFTRTYVLKSVHFSNFGKMHFPEKLWFRFLDEIR